MAAAKFSVGKQTGGGGSGPSVSLSGVPTNPPRVITCRSCHRKKPTQCI